MTDSDIVAELRRLYADSTTDGDRSWVHGDVVNERGCVLFSGRRCIEVGTIFTQEDADLIVAMHEALPALLDLAEAELGIPANRKAGIEGEETDEWWAERTRLYELRKSALAALKRSGGE